jgi:TPR repeat protein
MRTLILALTLIFAPLDVAFAQLPQTREELTALAEAGNTDAMFELGIMLLSEDEAAGREWTRRAAEAGNVEAMNGYAVILRNSENEADRAESGRWEERAFTAGSQGARLNRGGRLIYEDGSDAAWTQGFELISSFEHVNAGDTIANMALDYSGTRHATPTRVRELLRLSAERGSALGQWHYAMMLRQGQGGPADVPQAYEWVRRSGEGGFIDGMISTAVMLAMGEGVTQNDAEARVWYQRAVELSSAHALRGLGFMLITGEGGAVDEARGWAYMLLAAEGGDQTAVDVMNEYGRSLPAQTMQAASAIRTEWLATHAPPR